MYRRVCNRVRGRRWSSSAKSTSSTPPPVPPPSPAITDTTVESTMNVSSRISTPGMLRVTKGYGADKHEAELDSTLARVIGSDWGDRSHQPVSLPMRMYWIVFTVVLVNGLYTYFGGKDESFLVEKLKKKVDEKLGVQEETNELVAMNDVRQKDSSAAFQTMPAPSSEETMAVMAPPTMLNSSVGSSCWMPFLVPGMSMQMKTNARHSMSKEELEQQLTQLRMNQKRLQKQICSVVGAAKDELEHQVRMIDIQKEQVKLQIKRL
ncbi:unnamed protein product [Peronospora belbahrii]|uniref:Uncharacterized protein n=1 Tax=Peronospora belbahrii TaxID=622444 RepID=A0AAU9LEM1_9STRA|nr:unnamed protein product [Peronospora belbahrii]CAH0520956.1 unnamed protein product [Peronospora belbahrii]